MYFIIYFCFEVTYCIVKWKQCKFVCVCVCVFVYIFFFYRQVNSEAAVNCVQVKANRCSGQKAVKKKENFWKTDWSFRWFGYVVGVGNVWYFCNWPRSFGVVSVRRAATEWSGQRPSQKAQFKGRSEYFNLKNCFLVSESIEIFLQRTGYSIRKFGLSAAHNFR